MALVKYCVPSCALNPSQTVLSLNRPVIPISKTLICWHWPLFLTMTMRVPTPLDEIHPSVLCHRHLLPTFLIPHTLHEHLTCDKSLLITHHGSFIYITFIPFQIVTYMSKKHISILMLSMSIFYNQAQFPTNYLSLDFCGRPGIPRR